MEQRTDEWFEARLGKVTASRITDALAAPSTAAYANYQAQLIAERLTGKPYETHQTSAMQWGIDQEDDARSFYEFLRDTGVIDNGFIDHPTINFAGASPDGLIGDDGQIEIKCPNTATHIKTLTTQKIESRYRNQMTWQMACTGRSWCDFISYDPRLPVEYRSCIIRFERDNEQIELMENKVQDFLRKLEDKLNEIKSKGEKDG